MRPRLSHAARGDRLAQMIALRLLVLLTAVAIAVCAAGYLISGERRYLAWAVRVLKYAGAAALIFFAVLLLERI